MKKNILIFGLIIGIIGIVNIFYMVNMLYNNPGFEGNDVLGYTAIVVVFSLTFFGVKNYRDKQSNGVISFGQAFKMGALIAFVGSTIYVVVWLFYYYLFVPDFIDQYTVHVLTVAENNGATPTEISEKAQEMKDFKKLYQNPLMVVLITYMEVLPIGLVVALIGSFILKRKSPQPSADN